eukprot:m.109371 g.109371  ORF g.109371 m.109371 type:complete len:861 (+) comp27951_c0_seq1:141-2723(+)
MSVSFIFVLVVVCNGVEKSLSSSQMNQRPYLIANPPVGGSPVRAFRGEYFEFYGNNQTSRYGDVDWHGDPVNLPADIVQRFDGKVMAVTGYEVNIVRTNPQTGDEEPVLAYEQYNHHYSGYMYGKKVQLSTNPDRPKVYGSHGALLPHFEFVNSKRSPELNGSCDMSGIWLNPTNNVKVNVSKSGTGVYTAACIGAVGWKDAKITVSSPTPGSSQGGATITVDDEPAADTTGEFVTYTEVPNCPPCSQISWKAGGAWVLEPYADMPKPKPTAVFPSVQAFSEGNGNEHRASYKGYPHGYAQLIESPTVFSNNAMIINTNKRLTDDHTPGPIGGPVPRTSLAPPNADYQGILECPCTTRKIKVLDGYTVVAVGECGSQVATPTECSQAATLSGIVGVQPTTINATTEPAGCVAEISPDGSWSLQFNSNSTSMVECGAGAQSSLVGAGSVGDVDVRFGFDAQAKTITLTMSCATKGNWFGVGLNASAMQGTYALVVDGSGVLSEHRLGNHVAGAVLPTTAKVISSTLNGGTRTVVAQLPITDVNFDFEQVTVGTFPIITAIGKSPLFSYHGERTSGLITFANVGAASCLCRDPTSNAGTIDGVRFNPNVCAPFPTSELLTTHNAICNISEYEGGLYCCHDKSVLLDADQQQPEPTDTWRLKYRFYFEEYTNQSNTFRVWWSTEATNNEYDMPKSTADCLNPATPAEDCIHELKSEFSGRDLVFGGSACMVSGDPSACADPKRIEQDGGYFQLTYAAFHCHAPACMSGELWNRDTGELICRNEALYGTGTTASNETGYVVGIPPCVWGSKEEGLQPFPILHLTSNLTTIKRGNNTNGHWGVMALWQSRASYVQNASVVKQMIK